MSLHALLRGLAIVSIAPIAAATLTACGPREADDAAPAEPAEISGRYEVRGITTDPASPTKRRIEGTVILARDGDRYTATYELETVWPTEGGVTDAQVVGIGEGAIDGNTLTGTAHTQLVISSVPGVDTGFAFVPRIVTTRLVSNSVATIAADGSITLDIENRGAEGEDYRATRTHATGRRVATTRTPPDAVAP